MYLLQDWPAEGDCQQCPDGWNLVHNHAHPCGVLQRCAVRDSVRAVRHTARSQTLITNGLIVMNSYLPDSSQTLAEWQGEVEEVARQLRRERGVGSQRRSIIWGGDFTSELLANCEGCTGTAAGFTSSTTTTSYRERSDILFKVCRDHKLVVATTFTELGATAADRWTWTGPESPDESHRDDNSTTSSAVVAL